MTTIQSEVLDIALDQLSGIDEFAFEVLHMDREMVMEEFDDVFEKTREMSFSQLTCRGMYKSFPIESIGNGAVTVEGGASFESELLADKLKSADELVLYAATVHGFEDLVKNPGNDTFDNMFYNGLSIGVSMSAHRWLKSRIAEIAHDAGRYVGRGWVPGEDALDLSLQAVLYDLLDPSQIGIKLLETNLMHPLMSVSGIMGVSNEESIETEGADIVSYH